MIGAAPAGADGAVGSSCRHCGQPLKLGTGDRFCCVGCATAFDLIHGLGLGRYYAQRTLDPAARAPRPEPTVRFELGRHVRAGSDGTLRLHLMVDGLQCGACVWLIESVLAREPRLLDGRLNLSTRRLTLRWRGRAEDAAALIEPVERLGYRLVPFDPERMAAAADRTGRRLTQALAVAGFAAGNVMLLSAGIWAGGSTMGQATRDLLHWISALIALPAVAYAGRPFFGSAWAAVRAGRTNMDVPISVGVLLVTGLSLIQTARSAEHAYFDSAVALLFFLLIGRVLDHRARGAARASVEQLLLLRASDVMVLGADGRPALQPLDSVVPGDRILVGAGEKVPCDGVVEHGRSTLDAALVTGESLPTPAIPGTAVFAGTINLGAALTIRVTAVGETTLLAECARLIEAAESRRGRFVALADRVAQAYTPVVHGLALATFLVWWAGLGAPWPAALLTAVSVLIVTCPCALALAVPAVQVAATGRLLRRGVLVTSPTAFERLARADMVVFDKTGTLTEPDLVPVADSDPAALAVAAGLAASSRHPLARALQHAATVVEPAPATVCEVPGEGLRCFGPAGEVRLGSRRFCGIPAAADDDRPELWLARTGRPPVRFAFAERLRPDARATVDRLSRAGYDLALLSGDRPAAVAAVAGELGIATWRGAVTPVEKVEALSRSGRRVLMVGDGLNDGPALASALVSMSPTSAADLSQTVADVVFQGGRLDSVATALETARRARRLIRQNLALSLGYNLAVVPLAMAGLLTPWLAAFAMSSSSLAVMLNSLRAGR